MLRNPGEIEKFERRLARKTKPDYEKNLRIYEALLDEARTLGVFPGPDKYEGIEIHTRISRMLKRAEKIARNRRKRTR
jgi:hypothetical protein